MNRYNELKLQVLTLFASTQDEWLGPNEAAEKLDFFPARSAWTYFKRLWSFGLFGVSRDGERCSTGSARRAGRDYAGCGRSGVEHGVSLPPPTAEALLARQGEEDASESVDFPY
jgi:hypothetical protein